MTFPRALSILPLLSLAFLATPIQAASWTVSCSVGGNVVHVEELPEEHAEQRESAIRARYPTAACVFLSDAVTPAPAAIASGSGSNPIDLEAALRAISGESLEVAFPSPPEPEVQTDADGPSLSAPPDHRPATPGWIRLSMYRTEDISDALADWSRITDSEPSFRFLTPSVARVDKDHVMLSVGPVRESEKAGVCVAAVSLGLECLSGPALPDDNDVAVEYLAAMFPGSVDLPVRNECAPSKPLEAYGQDLPAGSRRALTCLRSGFAADPEFVPFDPTEPVVVVFSSDPPLPRPRPTGNRAVSG